MVFVSMATNADFVVGQSAQTTTTREVVSSGFSNGTIRIGYFMQVVAPQYWIGAINLAIEQAQTDGLLPGYGFR